MMHSGVAAVLWSDLQDHADAKEPPCPACLERCKSIVDFFSIFKDMLHG